jgi:hypothetical protein
MINMPLSFNQVFDYDWGLQDDFMGSCQLDITALELGRPQDLVLCLRDPNKPMQDMGEIVLNVTLWPKTQEDKEQVSQSLVALRLVRNGVAELSNLRKDRSPDW